MECDMEYKKIVATLLVLCGLVCSIQPAAAAETMSESDFATMLGKVLEKNPELVLSVLRKHSEDVLTIAQDGANVRRTQMLEEQWKKELGEKKVVDLAGRPVLGSKKAGVSIVAFSDFTCPYCYQGYKTVKLMMKKYEGKVNLIFKHMPLDKKQVGYLAAQYFVAASLQSEAKAWALYDAFFEQRDALIATGEAFLKKQAKAAGLDMERLAKDIEDGAATAIIDKDLADSEALNIQGTPFFLVNNLTIRGALDPDNFEKAVLMAMRYGRR
jgi:protein-disulfide isomerase